MNYKLLRALFVLVGLAGLAGFAYVFYEFVQNRDTRLASLNLDKLVKEIRPPKKDIAGGPRPYNSGDYDVLFKLDVYSNRRAVQGSIDDGPPPPPPPVISDKDLVLAAIQYVEGLPEACRAYIYPKGVQAQEGRLLGDYYAIGDPVSVQLQGKPAVELRLDAIRPEEVDLSITGKEDSTFSLRRNVFQVPNTSAVQFADGSTEVVARAPAPERTKMSSQDYWVVGTQDVETWRELSEDEVIAALPSKPAYDEARRVKGQRIGRIPKDSVFADRGLQEGDIVLSVNGYPAKDRADLVRYLREQAEIDTFVVEVERAGGVRAITYRVPG